MIHQLHEVWCLSPPSSLTLTASAASASPTPADAVARSEACSGHLTIVTGRACDVRSTSKQSADSRYAETQAASCHRSLPTRACSIALWHVASPLQTTVHEYFAYAQYNVYRDLSRRGGTNSRARNRCFQVTLLRGLHPSRSGRQAHPASSKSRRGRIGGSSRHPARQDVRTHCRIRGLRRYAAQRFSLLLAG